MNFFESISVALEAIIANKMRSLLTMLGIIIGISSVITIVALGDGSQRLIQKEFESFGVGRAYLGINWMEDIALRHYFTPDDLDLLQTNFHEDLKGISPYFETTGKVLQRSDDISLDISGVNEQYGDIDTLTMKSGRFLMKDDITNFRNVTIIDEDFAYKVFGRGDVIGQSIAYVVGDNTLSMTIVGIYEKKPPVFAALAGGEERPSVYVPYSVLEATLYEDDMRNLFSGLQINFNEDANAQQTLDRMVTLVERRHGVEGLNFYRGSTAESELALVDQIMSILTLVIGAIAAISLLVGGIGVMNIMLVSVTERTKEIGIRKAIGAKYKDIMAQFLIESMIISALGGMIGIVLGLGLSTLIALIVGFPPSISIGAVLIATLFSSAVGVFFGYYPARKAARLDPIDALRYE